MAPPKKDNAVGGGGKLDGRGQNGRSGFRTDTAISNSRFGNERTLQPWIPDASDGIDGSLEASSSGGGGGGWDQFAENEKRFGLKTDYDENMYTTAIDKSHPKYRERMAAAERKAREIERSLPATSHVAEERQVDYKAGSGTGDENEEDKYSGVRRQEFPPLAGNGASQNKYTPPARRAPVAQSSVKGAPIDPAIISSQIKAPAKKQGTGSATQSRGQTPDPAKNGAPAKQEAQKLTESKAAEAKPDESKTSDANASEPAAAAAVAQSTASSSRNVAPGSKDTAPSATSTVERDVLKDFKTFASQQRMNAEKVRSSKAKADKEVKLTELRKFANSFKLSTPVPNDLVSIIAKDPAKQKEIQAKAIKNAEEMATKDKDDSPSSDKTTDTKDVSTKTANSSAVATATDNRTARTGNATHTANRHTGQRQQYPQQQYHQQNFRNNRGPAHNLAQQQTGTLAQRLRNVEQQKFSQPPTSHHGQDARAPPTGPANNGDSGFNRRHSGLPGHMGAKLNPNSHEFRPSPHAAAFNPTSQASTTSSPRSAVNNVAESAPAGQLIRRKTKAIDVNKCNILAHIKTITPPQGRKWDDNGGLRPSFDTLPTWRQLQDDEKADSTMHLTYKEYMERNPFAGQSTATPNPPHAMPHLAHQHQLPFHLQQGSHNMGQRGSPHMPPMQMHNHQGPHPPYGGDDHRMMPSNSSQSFASPRMGQMPMAYPGVNSPGQMAYNQPVYMGPGNPQMGQYRSFSNGPHYGHPQQGHMMMQPQFMPGPQGMVGGPQMMYPGAHPQFIPPSGPPHPGPGANGYPSPGRPSAPAMAHQGSQQGQPMYGMSPNGQYNQPAYGQGQPSGPSQ